MNCICVRKVFVQSCWLYAGNSICNLTAFGCIMHILCTAYILFNFAYDYYTVSTSECSWHLLGLCLYYFTNSCNMKTIHGRLHTATVATTDS